MDVNSEKPPFDNRKFIQPTARYIGSPPWSTRSPQVPAVNEFAHASTPESSSLTGLLRMIWNAKFQILIHSSIIFTLLSSTGMKAVSKYEISPPLRYMAQILCQHDPTGYLRHGCDLISLAPLGPTPTTGLSSSHPHPSPPRRNFAAHKGGATILRQYTSSTHGKTPCMRWPFVVRSCELENMQINSPNIALEESTEEGDCWEFSGSSGQLAFNLSQSIFITDVGLDYPDSALLSQIAYNKIPREVSVWSLANDLDLLNVESSLVTTVHAEDFAIQQYPASQAKLEGTFIRIAQFQYTPSPYATSTKQLFSISNQIPKISSRTIIIKVENNFGAPTTCIYWVGVFGETLPR